MFSFEYRTVTILDGQTKQQSEQPCIEKAIERN